LLLYTELLPASIGGYQHPSHGDLLNNIGNIFFDKGQLDEALTNYQKAYAIYKLVYPKDHPAIGDLLNNIGNVLSLQDKKDLALVKYKEAFEMYVLTSKNQISIKDILGNIGYLKSQGI